jgi:hypothetical protein
MDEPRENYGRRAPTDAEVADILRRMHRALERLPADRRPVSDRPTPREQVHHLCDQLIRKCKQATPNKRSDLARTYSFVRVLQRPLTGRDPIMAVQSAVGFIVSARTGSRTIDSKYQPIPLWRSQ